MDLRVFAFLMALMGLLAGDLPVVFNIAIANVLPHSQLWEHALHMLRMASGF